MAKKMSQRRLKFLSFSQKRKPKVIEIRKQKLKIRKEFPDCPHKKCLYEIKRVSTSYTSLKSS